MRGIKTLGIRMEEHERTPVASSEFLVERIPAVQKRVLSGAGDPSWARDRVKSKPAASAAMVSFESGSVEKADAVLKKTKYFTLGGEPRRGRKPSSRFRRA